MYTHDFPSEVAGLVLIESMTPRQFNATATEAPVSPALTSLPILGRLGIVRLLARPLGLIPDLPEDLQPAYLSRLVRPSNLQSMLDEAQGMPAGGAEAAGVKSFGNLPLIVFTARLNTDIPGWQAWQTELLQQSTNSQKLFAEKSSHNIEMEEPQAAVSAILQMVRQVRGQ